MNDLKTQPKVFTHADKIYLLFNPWAKGKFALMKIFIIN
jgi:hypothetical protein